VRQPLTCNSRQLFDNQRGRFWRAVRRDARLVDIQDAGCVFEGNTSTAPFIGALTNSLE
jgi:hypothetical protein